MSLRSWLRTVYPLLPRRPARRARRVRLELTPLEARITPSAVTDASKAAPADAATILHAPTMPGLTSLDPALAGAVVRSWDVPTAASAAAWLVGLASGQSSGVLGALGTLAAVPYRSLPNAFVLTLPSSEPISVTGPELGALTGVGYYAPLVAHQLVGQAVPDDPLFPQQVNLQNTGQSGGTPGADANVASVWDAYQGDGVVIGIVDDGLQYTHPDLAPNYVPALSHNFNDNSPDPAPDASNPHGTAVAGVAAARGFNGQGVTGAAPHALLAGLRLTAGPTTDALEAAALSYQSQHIDIYNNSWGPGDSGVLTSAGPLLLAALRDGATLGRDGLGNVYVWAAGNGQASHDNTNYDGYTNSRYALTVAGIDDQGKQAPYSEPGTSILVSAYSSGATNGVTSTDLTGAAGLNGLPDQDYTNEFGGTSAAAPLVSGVVALMLQANPSLSYRDVEQILVRTARQNDPTDPGWSVNGAGLHVNDKYGFGAIDAAAAVNLARTWSNVGPEVSTDTGTSAVNQAIPDNDPGGVSSSVNVTTNLRLEWVEVVFNASHPYRGDLEVVLTAPSGTQSVLARQRSEDGNADYAGWVFSTDRNWGEESAGTWTLTVRDLSGGDVGTFDSWQLRLHGTDLTAPAATTSPGTVIYVEKQAPQTVDPGLTVNANGLLSGAQVAITSGFMPGQDVLAFTSKAGISGAYNAATGVLALTGSASAADYQALLRSVTYVNNSVAPGTTPRVVSITLSADPNLAGTPVTRTVTVVSVDDAPVVTASTGAVTYTEGQPAVTVDASLTVSDVDSVNLSGATVAITSGFSAGQDMLAVASQPGINASYNAATGVLTLTGPASPAAFQAALRSVTYVNTSTNPAAATRTLSVTVSDGSLISVATRKVQVKAVNNPPVLAGLGGDATYAAGQPAIVIAPSLTLTDPDSPTLGGASVSISGGFVVGQDVLGFTPQLGISGNYNPATGVLTLSGAGSPASYQTVLRSVNYLNTSASPATPARTLTFRASDSAGAAGLGGAFVLVTTAPAPADSGGTTSGTVTGTTPTLTHTPSPEPLAGVGSDPSSPAPTSSGGGPTGSSSGGDGAAPTSPAPVPPTGPQPQLIGTFDPTQGLWYLPSVGSSGAVTVSPFAYGLPNWTPLIGDWNGDGMQTVGVVDPATLTWYLRNSNSAGPTDFTPFAYGGSGWKAIAGDWNGDGTTTVGVVDPSTMTWYLRNSNSAGPAAYTPFPFGGPGWISVTGDWNGDGVTTIGAVDPSTMTWYLRNSNSPGAPDLVFQYGGAGWKVVTGDWDGDGRTGIAVIDPGGFWYIRNTPGFGAPDFAPFPFGFGSWSPVAGVYRLPGAALHAADVGPGADLLDAATLQQAVQATLARLAQQGVDPATLQRLGEARYVTANLPGTQLGAADVADNRVVIDADAAGHGWFLDPTPLADEEFAPGSPLVALPGSAAAGREDLLTVLAHEMGHLAGRADLDAASHPDDLMAGVLATGTRRLGALDGVFTAGL